MENVTYLFYIKQHYKLLYTDAYCAFNSATQFAMVRVPRQYLSSSKWSSSLEGDFRFAADQAPWCQHAFRDSRQVMAVQRESAMHAYWHFIRVGAERISPPLFVVLRSPVHRRHWPFINSEITAQLADCDKVWTKLYDDNKLLFFKLRYLHTAAWCDCS